ncbi:MAG: hypothetical protein AAF770_01955 [Bacteroidota bacterium]
MKITSLLAIYFCIWRREAILAPYIELSKQFMFINYIRKNKILTGLFIGAIMAAFAGVPLIRLWDSVTIEVPFFAKINGHDVDYYLYKAKFDRLLLHYQHYSRDSKSKKYAAVYAHKKVWEQFLKREALKNISRALGVNHVTREELLDHLIGDSINEDFKNEFRDPKTGLFDRKKMIAWFKEQNKHQAGQQMLQQLEDNLKQDIQEKKIDIIINRSYKITKADQKQISKIEGIIKKISYILIPAASIPESRLDIITKKDKEDYLAKQQAKGKFQKKEGKQVIYAFFKVKPSSSDQEAPKKALEEIKNDFQAIIKCGNYDKAVAFAKKHSERPQNALVRLQEDKVPPLVRKQFKKGIQVVGPISGKPGSYLLYGLVKATKSWLGRGVTYTLAIIETHENITDETRQDTEIRVARFSHGVTSKEQFQEKAKKVEYKMMHIQTGEMTITEKDAKEVGYEDDFHKIAHWVYQKGKLNKPSKPIELAHDQYIVVMVTENKKPEPMSLDEANEAVKKDLIKERQIKTINQSIESKGNPLPSLQQIKQEYPHHAVIVENQTISAMDSSLQDVGKCPRVIGSILSMKKGDVKSFVCSQGVIVVQCLNQSKNKEKTKNRTSQKSRQAKKSMPKKVKNFFINNTKKKVKDRRYYFFHS